MNKNRLYILWTNADINTSRFMVMMYARNAMLKGWWDKVTVIVWGATAKLCAENGDIQQEIKAAREAGVEFSACLACARQFGVAEKLEEMGMETIFWGEPLTDIIKNGEPILTV